jgi:hypothetical protein
MYGYFPEASKSILVICQYNLEAAKENFALQQFRITTGEWYLGGYIEAKMVNKMNGLRRKRRAGLLR